MFPAPLLIRAISSCLALLMKCTCNQDTASIVCQVFLTLFTWPSVWDRGKEWVVEVEIPHALVVALDREPVSSSGYCLAAAQSNFWVRTDLRLGSISFSVWGCWCAGTGCPGGLWMPQPWQCAKPGWTRPWASRASLEGVCECEAWWYNCLESYLRWSQI